MKKTILSFILIFSFVCYLLPVEAYEISRKGEFNLELIKDNSFEKIDLSSEEVYGFLDENMNLEHVSNLEILNSNYVNLFKKISIDSDTEGMFVPNWTKTYNLFIKRNGKTYLPINIGIIANLSQGSSEVDGIESVFGLPITKDLRNKTQNEDIKIFLYPINDEVNLLSLNIFVPSFNTGSFRLKVDNPIIYKSVIDGMTIYLPSFSSNIAFDKEALKDIMNGNESFEYFEQFSIKTITDSVFSNNIFDKLNSVNFDYGKIKSNGLLVDILYQDLKTKDFSISLVENKERIMFDSVLDNNKIISEYAFYPLYLLKKNFDLNREDVLTNEETNYIYFSEDDTSFANYRFHPNEKFKTVKGDLFRLSAEPSSSYEDDNKIKRFIYKLDRKHSLDSIDSLRNLNKETLIITHALDSELNKYIGAQTQRRLDNVILNDTIYNYIKSFIDSKNKLSNFILTKLNYLFFGDDNNLSIFKKGFLSYDNQNSLDDGKQIDFGLELERLQNIKEEKIDDIYKSNIFNVNKFAKDSFAEDEDSLLLDYNNLLVFNANSSGVPVKKELFTDINSIARGEPFLDYSKEYFKQNSLREYIYSLLKDNTSKDFDTDGKDKFSFYYNPNFLYDRENNVVHILREGFDNEHKKEIQVDYYLIKNEGIEFLTSENKSTKGMSIASMGKEKNYEVVFSDSFFKEMDTPITKEDEFKKELLNELHPEYTDSSYIYDKFYFVSNSKDLNSGEDISNLLISEGVINNQFQTDFSVKFDDKKYKILYSNVVNDKVVAFVIEDLESYVKSGNTNFEMEYNPYDFYSKYEIGENIPKYTIKSNNEIDGILLNYLVENNPKIKQGNMFFKNSFYDLLKNLNDRGIKHLAFSDGNDNTSDKEILNTTRILEFTHNPLEPIISLNSTYEVYRLYKNKLRGIIKEIEKMPESEKGKAIAKINGVDPDLYGRNSYDLLNIFEKDKLPVDFYILCNGKPYITTSYKEVDNGKMSSHNLAFGFPPDSLFFIDNLWRKNSVLKMSEIFTVNPKITYLDFARNIIQDDDIYSYRLNLISAPLSYEDGYSHDFLVNATKFVGNTFAHNLIDKVQFRMNLPFSTADIMPEFDRYITDHTYITYERDVNEPNKITFQANFTTYDEDSKMGRIVQSYAIKQGITEAYYDLYGELFKKTITFDPNITIKDEDIERWLDSEVPFEYKRTENYCSDCLYSYNDKLENQAKPNPKIIDPLKEWEKLVQHKDKPKKKEKIKKVIKNIEKVKIYKDKENINQKQEFNRELADLLKELFQQNPFIIGFEDKTVRVEKPLTLSEFAAMMNRLDTGKMEKKVEGQKWYKEVIDKLDKSKIFDFNLTDEYVSRPISEADYNKIINFYNKMELKNNNLFKGKKYITRGEAIKMLHMLYNRKIINNSKFKNIFKDLKEKDFYFDLIMSSFYKFEY